MSDKEIQQASFESSGSVEWIEISIASPDAIHSWSKGEVKHHKTISHKTRLPFDDGLFCQRIFGPVKDWECSCGKYRGDKHHDVVCDVCGVEVTLARVRQERMGHIELAMPVCHTWFFRGNPSYIGLVLDVPAKDLKRVIYYQSYMVVDPGNTRLKQCQVLLGEREEQGSKEVYYHNACEEYTEGEFLAETGGRAIQEALRRIDLQKGIAELEQGLAKTRNKQTRSKLVRRLHLFKAFQAYGVRPEWMVLTALPVLPAGLRPLIALKEPKDDSLKYHDPCNACSEYHRRAPDVEKAYEELSREFSKEYPKKKKTPPEFSRTDINALYGRVIQQNNRLKALFEDNGARINIQNEKRKLQEAVDALLYGAPDDLDPINNIEDHLNTLAEEFSAIDENAGDAVRRLQKVAGKLLVLRGNDDEKTKEKNERVQFLVNRLKKCEIKIQDVKSELTGLVEEMLETGGNDWGGPKAKRQPLQSLSDKLKGKTGLFRQDLLGKRVDYSGRAVILVGPELELHQCGLPKRLALQLFEPFIIRRLKELGYVRADINLMKFLKIKGERAWHVFRHVTKDHDWNSGTSTLEGVVWNALHEVVAGRVVLLNRAPTLHRLSIQAFEPVLIEGEAIRLHPLVCAGFNADFDGDTMAVHVPLSVEAQMEARLLLMAPNNLFSPGSGKLIVTPTQDITLGCFYLTADPRTPQPTDPNQMSLFGSKTEAISAYSQGAVSTHKWVRLANPDFGKKTDFGDAAKKVIATTVGRIIFSEIWPEELGFYNGPVDKSDLGELIGRCYKTCGHAKTIATLDKLKEVGFREATRAGVSIGIDDLIIPEEREREIAVAQQRINDVEKQCREGLVKPDKRSERIEGIWKQCTDQVSIAMMQPLEANQGRGEYNPVWLMLKSGARGNQEQVRQLIGLRGQMRKPGGDIIEKPVLSNYREGLGVLDYFISSYGARKGVNDRSRQTGDAGYLTRRLVSVAQDVLIGEEDCGTSNGIWVEAIYDEKGEIVMSLADRLVGRVACEDVGHPSDADQVIVAANQEINEDQAKAVDQAGIRRVKVRSVLTCESKRGVCVYCYGRNPATGAMVKLGEAVGIIAAQSVGEPGTQLTMRTFHAGGTASQSDITGSLPRVEELFEARRPEDPATIAQIAGVVHSIADVDGKRCVVIKDPNTEGEHIHYIPPDKTVDVKEGHHVTKSQPFTQGLIDPHQILDICGSQELQRYFVTEVQKIYRPNGGVISDKHIEVILREMIRKVQITNPGDTTFLTGEQVDKLDFEEENRRVEKLGGKPSEAKPILLGITKASLQAKSFLSAASFQDTTKVLAEAASMSKRDELHGFKEKVMTGGLIPVGAGFDQNRNVRLKPLVRSENNIAPVVPASAVPDDPTHMGTGLPT